MFAKFWIKKSTALLRRGTVVAIVDGDAARGIGAVGAVGLVG